MANNIRRRDEMKKRLEVALKDGDSLNVISLLRDHSYLIHEKMGAYLGIVSLIKNISLYISIELLITNTHMTNQFILSICLSIYLPVCLSYQF